MKLHRIYRLIQVLPVMLAIVAWGWLYAPSSGVASPALACPSVAPTQLFTFVYGSVALGGSAAPVGTVVEARNPRGNTVGCTTVETAGVYPLMYIYGEQTVSGVVTPGMRTNEPVAFYVNNVLATPSPAFNWQDSWSSTRVDLSALSTPPDLSMSSKSASPTQIDSYQRVDYTITIHNTGGSAQVLITDTLPILLAYIPDSLFSTAGIPTYSESLGAVLWSGFVESTETVTVTFGMSGPFPVPAHSTPIENRVIIDDGFHAPFERTVTIVANPWPASISGTITIDTTGDNLGNDPHIGVTVALLDENGNAVLDGDNNPITTTTDDDGNYSFENVPAGTYQVAQTVPAGYTSVNDVDGGDLTVIGDVTPITVALGDSITGQDFVNFQVPDITPIITAIPNAMFGVTEFEIYVRTVELKGVDTSSTIVLRIPKDPRWQMHKGWNGSMSILPVSGIPVQNSIWTYTEDANFHSFTTTATMAGSSQATFGFEAKWDAGLTRGSYTLSVAIVPGSGGEVRINNNNDAETLEYTFQ